MKLTEKKSQKIYAILRFCKTFHQNYFNIIIRVGRVVKLVKHCKAPDGATISGYHTHTFSNKMG